MKTVYRRPQKASRKLLIAIGVYALGCLVLVEMSSGTKSNSEIELRKRAVEVARRSFDTIKTKRLGLGHQIDRRFDPNETGMIGLPISSFTSNPAELTDKQASVNPQFAAVAVHYLESAGVQPGDSVAIGWSGSFPALNVAVCAAVESMQLKPVAIASAMSSQYGANHDDLLWIDMEKAMWEEKLISFRSKRVSIGGAADRGLGSASEIEQPFQSAVDRTNTPAITARRRLASVNERMDVYNQLKAGNISAYINVGGGVASTGGSEAKTAFHYGVNRVLPAGITDASDGVMKRFVAQGVPVIHLVNARRMATDFQMHSSEGVTNGLLYANPPSRLLALISIATVLVVLHGFILTDFGHRCWMLLTTRLGFQSKVKLNVVHGTPVASELAA